MKHWLFALCTITASTQAAYSALRVLITYQALELGAGVVLVGVLAATHSLLPALVAVPLGRLVDRGHSVLILRAAVAFTIVAGLIVAGSLNLWVLTVGNLLLGFAQMATAVAGQGHTSLASEARDLDSHFSAWSMSTSIGQTIGLPLAGIVVTVSSSGDATNTTVAALTLSALVALSVPALYFIHATPSRSIADFTQRQSVVTMLGIPGMRSAVFSSMIVLTCMDLLSVYLPVLGAEKGFSVLVVTSLLTVRTVASLVARGVLPLLLRLVPRRWMLVGATLCPGLPLALVPFLDSPALIAIALGVVGVFWGIGQPLTMTWVVSIVHASNHASALALRMLANRVGQVAIPLASGVLAGASGVASVFLLSGLLMVTSGQATFRATRSRGQPDA